MEHETPPRCDFCGRSEAFCEALVASAYPTPSGAYVRICAACARRASRPEPLFGDLEAAGRVVRASCAFCCERYRVGALYLGAGARPQELPQDGAWLADARAPAAPSTERAAELAPSVEAQPSGRTEAFICLACAATIAAQCAYLVPLDAVARELAAQLGPEHEAAIHAHLSAQRDALGTAVADTLAQDPSPVALQPVALDADDCVVEHDDDDALELVCLRLRELSYRKRDQPFWSHVLAQCSPGWHAPPGLARPALRVGYALLLDAWHRGASAIVLRPEGLELTLDGRPEPWLREVFGRHRTLPWTIATELLWALGLGEIAARDPAQAPAYYSLALGGPVNQQWESPWFDLRIGVGLGGSVLRVISAQSPGRHAIVLQHERRSGGRPRLREKLAMAQPATPPTRQKTVALKRRDAG